MEGLKVDFSSKKKLQLMANLFGDFRNQEEIYTVQELLLELGITANYLPPERMNSTVLQRANINIYHLLASEVTIQKRIQNRYDRPFLTVSFLGPSETAGALRDIGTVMGLSSSKTEQVIRRGLASVTDGINLYGAELYRKKAYLLLDDYRREIAGRILDDLGMTVINPPHNKQYRTPESLQKLIKKYGIHLIIGDHDQILPDNSEIPYFSLSEADQSFLGFRGFTNLARCISQVLKEKSLH
ncbi:nitrogenase component 1 [Desulforamulus putei]|uniref:nitrogenase component 1 n=1 Tax=Desulforamulus putei TaxID=74701 RepID=UPI002FDE887F